MRIYCLWLCLVFSGVLQAQYPKLVIQFANKGGTVGNFTNPSTYLSARAIARRTSQNIALDSTDLPVSQQYINTVLAQGPVTLLSRSKWLNQILVQCTDAATLQRIRQLPFVVSTRGLGFRPLPSTNYAVNGKRMETFQAFPEPTVNSSRLQNTPYNYFNATTQISLHNGQFLHNKGFRGQGIWIAMLDGGFNQYRTIAAFDSVRQGGRILGERDFVDFDNSVNEDDPHGRHCLSTIAANWPNQMVGTAPMASFWLLRTENAATEYPIEEFNWVAGAEFADSSGCDMISSSLGYIDFDDAQFNYSYSNFYNNSAISTKGAAAAARKGLIVMNSAGNSGTSAWRYLGFPSDADSVCAVAACDANRNIAGFSSWGWPGKVKPNVTAMGLNATVAGNTAAGVSSGTSFSNPIMAGLVACLWQAFPRLSNMQILNALYQSADRFANPDNRFGFGIPNMQTAYRNLKRAENTSLYGSTWFWATPNPFSDTVQVRFIGRVDGAVTVALVNSSGTVVATQNITSEREEMYTIRFTNLSALPGGTYTVRYTDGTTTQTANLQKLGPLFQDWLVATPNPFSNAFTVFVQPVATGTLTLRLLSADGKVVASKQQTVTQGTSVNISFTESALLPAGVYWLQAINGSAEKRISILKGK
jgi:serine protease AprX